MILEITHATGDHLGPVVLEQLGRDLDGTLAEVKFLVGGIELPLVSSEAEMTREILPRPWCFRRNH
jgi:hypothetical protein